MTENVQPAEVPLSQGRVAPLDPDDHARLSRFRWCYRPERGGAQGYAVRHVKEGGRAGLSYMHREVARPAEGLHVIFLNHDRLDCRKANLKAVSKDDALRHHR